MEEKNKNEKIKEEIETAKEKLKAEKEEKENRPISLDTMAGIGKKITIAGREYEIAPVNIMDMHYVIGSTENDNEPHLFIVDKKKIEDENEPDMNWQLFGLNITDKKRREVFLKVLNKYVKYKDHPMTEDMLIEHNWSFKEIGMFLYTWAQISD